MKNFEMCSTPVMAALVANFMRRIPMGEDMMMTAGLKFVYDDYDPNNFKWEVFRRLTRKALAKDHDMLEKSDWLVLWKKQHEDLFEEWFGDVVKKENA